MKKIIFLVFSLMSLNAFAISVSLGGGMHVGGTYDSLDGKVHDFQGSVPFINLEVTQGLVIGEVGVGASYEQGYEREDGITYDAIPVYGIVKLNVFPILIKPYIAAKYGTIFYQNVKGTANEFKSPVFYSLGLGVTLAGKVTVEGTAQGATYEFGGVEQGSATYGLTARYTF